MLAIYGLAAFVFLGLPIVGHPGSFFVGHRPDPEISIWSFAWWPHAILHGLEPAQTHAVWFPTGINLTWTTSVPGLALLFSPLTLLAGPVIAYNVAAVLMPALSAWTMYLFARRLTGKVWPSFVAGYLYGFSSYLLAQEASGHLGQSAVFLVPLAALIVYRFLEGELGGRGLVLRLGVVLALQMSFSTELLFTLSLALATTLTIAALAVPSRRSRLLALLPPLAGAYLLAAILAAPLVYYLLVGFQSGAVNPIDRYAIDLANLAVPTPIAQIGGTLAASISSRFPGNEGEQGAYLGLPGLALVGWFAVRRWRSPGGRVLLLGLLVALVASLGTSLHVAGHALVELPWALVHDWPLLDNVVTSRLSLYVTLAAALAVSLWIAGSRSRLRVGLPLVAMLAIAPHLTGSPWRWQPDTPRFFTTGLYRDCLEPGEDVVVLPFGYLGDSMLWQAESGFYFNQTGGYISGLYPKPFEQLATPHDLATDRPPPGGRRGLLRFARAYGARAILVDERHPGRWRALLAGVPSRTVGDVVIYELAPEGPALARACARAPRSATA